MFVEELKIENIRCFANFTLKSSAPMNGRARTDAEARMKMRSIVQAMNQITSLLLEII
jgi:hypothetical protein